MGASAIGIKSPVDITIFPDIVPPVSGKNVPESELVFTFKVVPEICKLEPKLN